MSILPLILGEALHRECSEEKVRIRTWLHLTLLVILVIALLTARGLHGKGLQDRRLVVRWCRDEESRQPQSDDRQTAVTPFFRDPRGAQLSAGT